MGVITFTKFSHTFSQQTRFCKLISIGTYCYALTTHIVYKFSSHAILYTHTADLVFETRYSTTGFIHKFMNIRVHLGCRCNDVLRALTIKRFVLNESTNYRVVTTNRFLQLRHVKLNHSLSFSANL